MWFVDYLRRCLTCIAVRLFTLKNNGLQQGRNCQEKVFDDVLNTVVLHLLEAMHSLKIKEFL